jgi:hypothetical protein
MEVVDDLPRQLGKDGDPLGAAVDLMERRVGINR